MLKQDEFHRYGVSEGENGFQVCDIVWGVQAYYEDNDISSLSDLIVWAFNTCTPIQLSEWEMPNGFEDVSNTRLYIENMGFQMKKLYLFDNAFSPWNNNDSELWFLSDWEPGANVNYMGMWSKFETKTPRSQQVEHIDSDFDRFCKWDANSYEDNQIDASIDCIMDMHLDEDKDWRERRKSDGLYSVGGGKKFKHKHKDGFRYKDKLIPFNFIKKNDNMYSFVIPKMNSTEKKQETRQYRRRCKMCYEQFYKSELVGGLCKDCQEKLLMQ